MGGIRIVRKTSEMQSLSSKVKREGRTIGFVPTMGYLHDGHLSLMRRARKDNDLVVLSIFVNPIQFGPHEDYKKYPRDFKKDERLAKGAGVDVLFYPAVKEVYPDGYSTYVEVDTLSNVLCGASRPGHFKGVTTVVAKLFNIVQPDKAYFGQKDAQQTIIIKKMVSDLNIGLKIKVMPIVREEDGLAMSSRNIYLSVEERRDAAVLFSSLQEAVDMIKSGEIISSRVISRIRDMIGEKKTARIDYVTIVDPLTLKGVKRISGAVLIALAVWAGKTRLIDNMVVYG